MELLLAVVFAGLVCYTHAASNSSLFTDDEWKQCVLNVPDKTLRVKFGDITIDNENQGQTVPSTATLTAPYCEYFHQYGVLHAIIMFAVDEEGCTDKVPILWFVKNIPGADVNEGQVDIPYTPPPGNISKPYRCAIIIAKQSRKLPAKSTTLTSLPVVAQLSNSLVRQKVQDVMSDNGLTVIGGVTFYTEKLVPS